MRSLWPAACVLWAAAATSEAAVPQFTRKPTATKAGAVVTIGFAVDRQTDVAVFIEDGRGRVVRHLVAGMLGKNPPPPLKPGLAQSIEWDGKADYGEAAGPGPFKVRVALGVGAKYDRVLIDDPYTTGAIYSIAVGPPDGTLYVIQKNMGSGNYYAAGMIAFNRDGTYQRMLMPFPSNLPYDRIKGFDGTVLEGRAVPMVQSIRNRSLYPISTYSKARKIGMAITSDGVIVRPGGGYESESNRPACLSALKTDGGDAWGRHQGPKLVKFERSNFTGNTSLCLSSDEKWAYLSGLSVATGPGIPAVYRVKLPERAPAELFFGDTGKKGAGEGLVGSHARGLAVDGKGHLLVSDTANNRVIAVGEKDGKYVGEMKVTSPAWLAVDAKTGALYLTRLVGSSGAVELVKYDGWKTGRELAKLPVKAEGNPRYPWLMVLDPGAEPPVVWMASGTGSLLRVEDQGAKFEPRRVNRKDKGNASFVDVVADRWGKDNEIYARCAVSSDGYWWFRYNEASDKFEKLQLPVERASGSCITPAPGGLLYAKSYPYHMLRFTRDAKPAPWESGSYPKEYVQKYGEVGPVKPGPKHGTFVPVSMTFMTHTLGVRHDGHLFALEPGRIGGKPCKMLREYLPSGKLARPEPIIWLLSDYAVGPKFDQEGNMYFAELVRPLDDLYPKVFEKQVGEVDMGKRYEGSHTGHYVLGMYGSIVKFTPKGGMIHYAPDSKNGKPLPYEDAGLGPPKLADGLQKTKAAWYALSEEGRARVREWRTVDVTGAEWIRMGISHVEHARCNCENVRFDVDEFGRVWYPDMGRFRVGVLDTNGNRITHFGGYGNADSRGPESRDKSLAEPDIAFSWLVGVGVTDRYAYMGDSLNRRLLRARLVYAAEETVAVR